MRIHDRVSLVLAAAVLGLGAGCSTPPPATPRMDPISRSAYPNIVVTPALARELVVADSVVLPSEGLEPLAVRVPVRSVVRRSLLLEYRLVFYTKHDEQLTSNPVWMPVEIPALTRRIISGNAISRQATRWELEIRER